MWKPAGKEASYTILPKHRAAQRFFTLSDRDRTHGNGLKLKQGRLRLDVRGEFFTQMAVRRWHSCPEKLWCPIPGGTQGQVGWGPGQPELVGGSPAHNRGWGGWAFRPSPTQTLLDLWFVLPFSKKKKKFIHASMFSCSPTGAPLRNRLCWQSQGKLVWAAR